MASFLGIPSLVVSAAASALYAAFGAVWLATERPRVTLLSTSQFAASIVAKAVLQLTVSLLLSLVAYAAIYAAFVPEAGVVNDLHFGLCQPPLAADAAATTEAPSAVGDPVVVARARRRRRRRRRRRLLRERRGDEAHFASSGDSFGSETGRRLQS